MYWWASILLYLLGVSSGIYAGYYYYKNILNAPTAPEDQLKLVTDIREHVTKYILTADTAVFNAIAKQKSILNSQNRNAVAIFLDIEQSTRILNAVLGTEKQKHTEELINAIDTLGMPFAYIGDMPVYISRLLDNAPVFVAGGIKWTLND